MHRDIYVSDRRWKKIARLLKTSAFMHGRNAVDITDVFVIHHCLWNNPEEYEDVKQVVMRAISAPLSEQLKHIRLLLDADLRATNVSKAVKMIEETGTDSRLKIYDHFYYYIVGHGTGNTFIFLTDLRRLHIYGPDEIKRRVAPTQGIMYHPTFDPDRTVIRVMTDIGLDADIQRSLENVSLYRDSEHLYINGVRYDIDMLQPGEEQHLGIGDALSVSQLDYIAEVGKIKKKINNLHEILLANMFISEDDSHEIEHYFLNVKKDIDLMQVDIEKLAYE